MKTYTLRIGICQCTTRWHSRITGKTIVIKRTSGHRLDHSIQVRFEEALIPERQQQVVLEKQWCSFFLDCHKIGGAGGFYSVSLFPLTPIRAVGKHGLYKICYNVSDMLGKRYWYDPKPPTIRELLIAIGQEMRKLRPDRLEDWLKDMDCCSRKQVNKRCQSQTITQGIGQVLVDWRFVGP